MSERLEDYFPDDETLRENGIRREGFIFHSTEHKRTQVTITGATTKVRDKVEPNGAPLEIRMSYKNHSYLGISEEEPSELLALGFNIKGAFLTGLTYLLNF